jgi:hypothetical protein
MANDMVCDLFSLLFAKKLKHRTDLVTVLSEHISRGESSAWILKLLLNTPTINYLIIIINYLLFTYTPRSQKQASSRPFSARLFPHFRLYFTIPPGIFHQLS